MDETHDITHLLQAARAGDAVARERLLPQVYDELRRLAASYMRRERAGHTLQATALVHEAYLRLAAAEAEASDRVHFFALAAQMMRRILVDHARSRARDKRGGGLAQVTLDESVLLSAESEAAVLELDDALQKLAAFDERAAHAVELMFFGGLSYEEAGEVLGVSKTTVFEDLKLAKAWLAREMGQP
jgi:RNA polymerase sigma factor (TIGR02999 family)